MLSSGAQLSIEIMEMVSSFAKTPGPRQEGRLREIDKMRGVLVSGLPVANGHALVGVWGAFEAWSEDLAAAWVREDAYRPDMRRLAALADRFGTQVPLKSLLADRDQAVIDATLGMLDSASKSAVGLGSIEARLEPIGLSVRVDKRTRDRLYYAEKIRHPYAHRAGLADSKFLAECPAIAAVEGERVRIDNAAVHEYLGAFRSYVHGVLRKVKSLLSAQESQVGTEPSG